MRTVRHATALLSLALSLGCALPAAAQFPQFYAQHNLVSDLPGVADLQDPSLVNAWGLTSSATSPWWVANNGSGTSTLYNTSGPSVAKLGLTVSIPGGVPTGAVFNCGTGFKVTDAMGHTASSVFIFAGEDGSISGWAPSVPPPAPSMQATIAIQPSSKVYKGLAISCTIFGDFLYATDFHDGKVDVYDSNFNLQSTPGTFVDPRIPEHYAPFGIRNIGGIIYVTYALQDDVAHDDVPGVGNGFVNAFMTSGLLINRVASRGTLNSPWGLAMAPTDLSKFSGALLVGNFGDGRIHAYRQLVLPFGPFIPMGPLRGATGEPIEIDGLWALSYGNGAAAGPTSTLFFTAGPMDEMHGLFGELVVTTPPANMNLNDEGD